MAKRMVLSMEIITITDKITATINIKEATYLVSELTLLSVSLGY